MYPVICHIYGPIYLNTYSVFLMAAILVFLRNVSKYTTSQFLDKYIITNLIIESSLVGIIGGRILHVLSDTSQYSNMLDAFKIWEGGLSVLGSMFSVTIYAIWYCKNYNLPILNILDIGGIHAPIIHAIARFGCFFAGCCYGIPTNLPWAVTYTDTLSSAPLNCALHPTQIYSALIYFFIFLIMKMQSKSKFWHKGQMFALYFFLSGVERFLVDFWRNDRIFNNVTHLTTNNYLSFYQLISMAIILGGCILLILLPFFENHELSKSFQANIR